MNIKLYSALFSLIIISGCTTQHETPTKSASKNINIAVFSDHFELNNQKLKPPFKLSTLEKIIGPADRVLHSGRKYYWDNIGLEAFSPETEGDRNIESLSAKLSSDWGYLGTIVPSTREKYEGSLSIDGIPIKNIYKFDTLGFKGNCRVSEDKKFNIELLTPGNNVNLLIVLASKPVLGCVL